MKLSSETENLFTVLRQSAKPKQVSAIEKLMQDGPDRELCRINAIAFAAKHKLNEEDVIAAFLHGGNGEVPDARPSNGGCAEDARSSEGLERRFAA